MVLLKSTLSVLVLLCGITVITTGQALALDDCIGTTPRLHFSSKTANTKYIRTKSSGDLKQMHGSAGGGAVGGLGGGEIGFRTQAQFEITESTGRACVRLKEVAVEFYAYPSIHVASNFDRASCEYNAVMAHERKHVAELRKFVREYTPKTHKDVQQLLYAIDTAIGPIPSDQIAKAQKKLQSDLFSYLQTYQARIMPELTKRQQVIDSPSEYARVTAQCSGWGSKLGGAQ